MTSELRSGKRRLGRVSAPSRALRIGSGGTGTLSVTATRTLRRRVAAFRRANGRARLTLVLVVRTTPGGERPVTRTLRIRAS